MTVTNQGCGYPARYCGVCEGFEHLHICAEPGCHAWVDDRDPSSGVIEFCNDAIGYPIACGARCAEHPKVSNLPTEVSHV